MEEKSKDVAGSKVGIHSWITAKTVVISLFVLVAIVAIVLVSPLGEKYFGLRVDDNPSSADTTPARYVNNINGPGAYYKVEDGKLFPVSHPGKDVLACLNVPESQIGSATAEESVLPIQESQPIFCNPQATAPHPHGTLIAGIPGGVASSGYYIEYGSIRTIASHEIMLCNNFDYTKYELANSEDLKLPFGEGMTCGEAKFVNNVNGPGAYYKVEGTKLVPVSHVGTKVLECLGVQASNITSATPAEAAYPIVTNRTIFCNPPSEAPHPDGTLLSGHPGGVASSVYLVEGGKLRPFPSGETFTCNNYDYANIEIANTKDITLPIGAGMFCPDKHYVNNVNGPDAYYKVLNGTLLPVSHIGIQVLECLGVSTAYILPATPAEAALPVDDSQTIYCNPQSSTRHPDGTLLSGLPNLAPIGGVASTVSIIENGKVRPISTPEIFACNNYDYANIELANTADIALPIGTALTCPTVSPTPTPNPTVTPTPTATPTATPTPTPTPTPRSGGGGGGGSRGGGSNPTPTPTPTPPGLQYPSDQAHPQGTLIKNGSVDQTIWVIRNNTRQPFLSAEIFISHGYRWSNVQQATSVDMALPLGDYIRFASGSVVLSPNYANKGNTVYIIYPNNTKRGFTNYQAFKDMGYTEAMILHSGIGALDAYTAGTPIANVEAHAPGTDVIANKVVYYIDGDTRITYPNMDIFNSWHFKDNDFTWVVPANSFDMAKPVTGPVVYR